MLEIIASTSVFEESPDSTERRGQLTTAESNLKESAAENRPPAMVRVKRWCKRPPVFFVRRVAW